MRCEKLVRCSSSHHTMYVHLGVLTLRKYHGRLKLFLSRRVVRRWQVRLQIPERFPATRVIPHQQIKTTDQYPEFKVSLVYTLPIKVLASGNSSCWRGKYTWDSANAWYDWRITQLGRSTMGLKIPCSLSSLGHCISGTLQPRVLVRGISYQLLRHDVGVRYQLTTMSSKQRKSLVRCHLKISI